MVTNIASRVAQRMKTRWQRSPILWIMRARERKKKNSTGTELLRFQNSLLLQTTINTEQRKPKNHRRTNFCPKWVNAVRPLKEISQMLLHHPPASSWNLQREGPSSQCGAEAVGSSYAPNKWQAAAAVKALQNSSKPRENRRTSALCHLSSSGCDLKTCPKQHVQKPRENKRACCMCVGYFERDATSPPSCGMG